MTRSTRALAWGVGALAVAGVFGVLFVGWLAPGNVLALWSLAVFCR